MRTVELLLRDRVENLGRCGDVVRVAPGFARNYLLPRRLAVPATEENKRMLTRRTERLLAEEAAQIAELSARAEALSQVSLKTVEKCDERGHLYGSVNAVRVAELLSEAGFACEEKQVRMAKALKLVGEHGIEIHLHAEVSAEISLRIEGENGMTEPVVEASLVPEPEPEPEPEAEPEPESDAPAADEEPEA
ncbi:MAG: 50S ribosomal protein L9 [Planctomycetota bacterium]|jgi:large subunit ribosomal protein L9|nr:50S ribosomal protein L9 [Planctomycetota bacterium]